MNRFYLALFFLVALLHTIRAQELSGIWEGHMAHGFGWHQPGKVILELNSETDSTFTGISHIYYGKKYYEHYVIRGSINRSRYSIIVKEVATISTKIGWTDESYRGTYFLTYSCSDTICQMNGTWRPWITPSILVAKKIGVSFQKIIPHHKDTIPVDNAPAEQLQPPIVNDSPVAIPEIRVPEPVTRQEDIQSIIEFNPKETDSVRLAIYDNGVIDNDTVSLFFNDKILVNKRMIHVKPISVAIAAKDITPYSKLKLYAENLGTIPPCTALMVIMVGKKRYEVSLSSDFRKNATVEFFLKE